MATRHQLETLKNHPNLQQFLIANVRITGKQLGVGSYGSVEEVEVGGIICAGKKIHETLIEHGNFGAENVASKYVEECQLMSNLRHPHVVQFLGVCFLPNSTLPVLVMERLLTSLDHLLEHSPDIPLSLKRSILADVARGLVYLHDHSPPVIHRDLSAKNVLLNSSMVAKISDLGNSRIVNFQAGQLAHTLSRIPGTMVYMPPEAFEATSKYGPSLDNFSFGHLSLFTITQVFPVNLLSHTYRDPKNPKHLFGRTEVERRDKYFQLLHQQLGEHHPLARLVKQCLDDQPSERPSTKELLKQLENMKAQIPDPYEDFTKLDAMRMLTKKDTALREKDTALREKDAALREKDTAFREKDAALREKDTAFREKDAALRKIVATVTEQTNTMTTSKGKDIDAAHCFLCAEKDVALREKDTVLREMDTALREKDTALRKIIATVTEMNLTGAGGPQRSEPAAPIAKPRTNVPSQDPTMTATFTPVFRYRYTGPGQSGYGLQFSESAPRSPQQPYQYAHESQPPPGSQIDGIMGNLCSKHEIVGTIGNLTPNTQGVMGGARSGAVCGASGGVVGGASVGGLPKNPMNHPVKLLCKTTGCSFKAVTELGGLCPDCYEEHYPSHVYPSSHVYPLRLLCKTTGCSFKAVTELGGLCPDCYEEHYPSYVYRLLCKTTGCSFKAVTELGGLCPDCYEELYPSQIYPRKD